jgi:hypothetical protein
MLAPTIGGFIAGRLRMKWVGVHTHEVFFRDTAHGFLAWGLATVVSAAFLAAAASNIAGGASSALASAAGVSATQSAGFGGQVDYYVDALLRSNPTASPNTTDLRATRAEIARILTNGVWSKYWSEASISSIANLIALITVPVPHRRPG